MVASISADIVRLTLMSTDDMIILCNNLKILLIMAKSIIRFGDA